MNSRELTYSVEFFLGKKDVFEHPASRVINQHASTAP